jgi:hypothetical protein
MVTLSPKLGWQLPLFQQSARHAHNHLVAPLYDIALLRAVGDGELVQDPMVAAVALKLVKGELATVVDAYHP